jgi:Response regulator containing a CheY-like receiver domain and an HTH DNA-binding domain
MIAAALIERHPLLRLGLFRVLRTIEGLDDVIAMAPSELADHVPAREVELLLLGLTGEPQADRQLLEHALAKLPSRHVLLLQEPVRAPALCHPAVDGCIEKTATPELIGAAVRLILAGGKCFPPAADCPYAAVAPAGTDDAENGNALRNGSARELPQRPRAMAIAAGARKLGITPRQFEVLMLLARGLSLKKVGRVLNISVATVKSHASATYRRLDARNKQQAIHEAIRRGADLRGEESF